MPPRRGGNDLGSRCYNDAAPDGALICIAAPNLKN